MQVLLLLKSSDRIAHDICNAFDGCLEKPAQPVAHTLALRKWVALKPEREFRCFVRGYDLVGKLALLYPELKASSIQCGVVCIHYSHFLYLQTCRARLHLLATLTLLAQNMSHVQ